MPEEKVFEIEVKSLLGGKEQAEHLLAAMKGRDPNLKLKSRHSQLNHYFEGGDLKKAIEKVAGKIDASSRKELAALGDAKNYSLRTRLADGKIILVLKISRDNHSSANGTNRIEFECAVNVPSLDDLDALLRDSGFRYQAKWSREREEYLFSGMTVTLDKNAGYGYLAEFEIVEKNPEDIEMAKYKIAKAMKELGVKELDQKRLERMFAFYNAHWPEYYGTDKIFTVE